MQPTHCADALHTPLAPQGSPTVTGLFCGVEPTQMSFVQSLPSAGMSAPSVTGLAATAPAATRAAEAPIIDGLAADLVWQNAPVISDFQEWRPTEGEAPRFRTEAKIAYDPSNLYVFVRAHDPNPDSIQHILERRDSFTPSDMIWVFVDSYHDRRSGYEFGVNAAGVKMDLAVYNDGNEDDAWDGVWDAATRTLLRAAQRSKLLPSQGQPCSSEE